ncbi:MFS transporter [Paraburkholderia sp.]|uniref:MFS transporter n=1 Tax=Paraburkholderia sp. TaxID=1926495 RepID=UPI003C7A8C79
MNSENYGILAIGQKHRDRWTVAWLLFIITIINYADRGVLGVVAPVLIKNFGLSIKEFGIIASGFGWGYVLFVFLGGAIVSVLGPKRSFMYSSVLWSIAIMLFGAASGFASLLGLRILFGASEGIVFPSGTQLIGNWFPDKEHVRATSLMGAGIPLGSLIVIPTAVWLTSAYGWRAPFLLLGVVGLIWAVLCKIYICDKPAESASVSIENAVAHAPSVPWSRILNSKTLWLTGAAFFSSAYVLYFILNFLPTYLVRERHMEFSHVAYFGALPWIFMAIGALISGPISDFVYKRTRSLRASRSYLAGICLVLTGVIISLTLFVTNTFLIVFLISIASLINFTTNPIFFAIPIDACPENSAAASSLTTGIGSLAGIFAPLLTGFIVNTTGTFYFAFMLVAALPILFGSLLILACDPRKL